MKVHMAKHVRSDGAVSPLCAKKPRAINMKVSSWTNREGAVTCKKCLRKFRELKHNKLPKDRK